MQSYEFFTIIKTYILLFFIIININAYLCTIKSGLEKTDGTLFVNNELYSPNKNYMAAGKWLGGFLGFITGGPLGALAGFVLGSIFDFGLNAVNDQTENTNRYSGNNYQNNFQDRYTTQQMYEGQRNSFLFSLLVLASYVINADGKIMHSEMELVRNFLRTNFGESSVSQGEEILNKLFEQQRNQNNSNPYAFRDTIRKCSAQIAANMEYSQRLQLLNFLVMIAQADGNVCTEEINAISEVALYMGIDKEDVDSMLNLRGASIDDAYKVLGVSPDSTDDEVRKAYRKLALKNHPDRVATLGDDIRKAAEKKFQEINEAKERIFKARGM